MRHDLIAGTPLFTYLRYNARLELEYLRDVLGLESIAASDVEPLNEMDAPENMERLREIGHRAGAAHVREEDFPTQFDLRE